MISPSFSVAEFVRIFDHPDLENHLGDGLPELGVLLSNIRHLAHTGRAHVGDAVRHKPESLGFQRQIGSMGATVIRAPAKDYQEGISDG